VNGNANPINTVPTASKQQDDEEPQRDQEGIIEKDAAVEEEECGSGTVRGRLAKADPCDE
jgi:hypothetical protein